MRTHEVIVIRPETDDEFDLCFQIRNEVFVIGQQVPEEDEYDGYDATAHHFLALCDGKPCGTARWRITDHGKIKLERFAVLDAFRGKGVGEALVKAVVSALPKNLPVYLHAQVQVIPFYLKYGFVEEGELFDECDIQHKVMVLFRN